MVFAEGRRLGGDHNHSGGGEGGATLVPAVRLDLPTVAADADAPDGTLFFHTGDNEYKFKDSGGAIRFPVGGTNVPGWVEDGNSPLSFSGGQSTTYTLSGTYDRVIVKVDEWRNTAGQQNLELQINGDTGANNYNRRRVDGSIQSDVGFWNVANNLDSGGHVSGDFRFDGRWTTHATYTATDIGVTDVGAWRAVGGNNTAVSSPLDSITFRGESGSIAVDANVYGWSQP